MSRPQSTGLVVPVDAVRELVAPWLHLLPAAGRALPPHVTALWPFLPVDALDAAAERRLEELLSGVRPFGFTLTRVATLADAIVLVPEPADPFAALTRLLWDEWPECPPFGGAFDDIAPHVVVAIDPSAGRPRGDRGGARAAAAARGPAAEVLLVEETGSGALRERRRFVLGGPDAPDGRGSSDPGPLERQLPADAELAGAAQRELAGHDVLERHPRLRHEHGRSSDSGRRATGRRRGRDGQVRRRSPRRAPPASAASRSRRPPG